MCIRIYLHVHLPGVYAHGNCYGSGFSYTYIFTNGDTYAPNADGNRNSDSHTDCYINGYIYADSNCHPNCNAHCYRYSHSETFSYAKSCANTQGSSSSAAAPVVRQSKLG